MEDQHPELLYYIIKSPVCKKEKNMIKHERKRKKKTP